MTKIQKYMMATFVRLRVGIGIIGIIFPFVLWGGGKIAGIPLADSMSAYYHANRDCLDPKRPGVCQTLDCSDRTRPESCTIKNPPKGTGPMRNWFVGILFVMGACLYLIQGFSNLENVFLNVAGILAICVALFPMPWSMDKTSGFPIHYVSAVIFFILIAFVCMFCSGKTLHHLPQTENKKRVIANYKIAYRSLAILMILSPVMAIVFNYTTRQSSKGFWMEAFGIGAFGVYWLVKTSELKRSEIGRKVLEGELDMDISSLR